MALSGIRDLATNLRQGISALGSGNVASASGSLGAAFGNIFHFVGAGMFAYSMVETLRNKELSWYEKLFPATLFGISAALSIATGVTMALALAAAVPILAFVGSTVTLVRNISVYFSEKWEKRRIKKDFKNKEKIENLIDKLGIPKDLQAEYEKFEKATSLLKAHRHLPQKLFESEPDDIEKMCKIANIDEKTIKTFQEASQIRKRIAAAQLPESLRNEIKDILIYRKDKKHMSERQMRDVMVRVINHSINRNQAQQEKIRGIMSVIPHASKESFENTLDLLSLPADKLEQHREFLNDAHLQNEIMMMLVGKNLSLDWLKQPQVDFEKELLDKGFDKAQIAVLRHAHDQYQLVEQYRLPDELKAELKIYLESLTNLNTPEEKQKAGDFVVKFADYFINSPKADKSSLMYTLVFESPDIKFTNIGDWMTKATKWRQENTEKQFKEDYGEVMDLFKRRQRLHTLSESAGDRLKIIGWNVVAVLLSAVATFVPMIMLATPAAPAAVPVYGALSAVAALPAAVAAFKGTKLAWKGYKLNKKVENVQGQVEYAVSPNVEEVVEKKKRAAVEEPGLFKRAANAIGSFFSGLLGKKKEMEISVPMHPKVETDVGVVRQPESDEADLASLEKETQTVAETEEVESGPRNMRSSLTTHFETVANKDSDSPVSEEGIEDKATNERLEQEGLESSKYSSKP
ncbi:hypothetical protein CC99x_002515 [Candidatus Berkiella cookevillensis]|uniref:Uncharacterized protein n=1 Tax=Candidatus Berkiella cookevillensis TaxID=437022 RepID=A0A0Q9YL01_9GAMM|nr:hypothetical protein [Candidatus Berkiella cookevillensis]MCS5707773.1 hypothetical protein [Candidatus Berkiella cookevillensis]